MLFFLPIESIFLFDAYVEPFLYATGSMFEAKRVNVAGASNKEEEEKKQELKIRKT